MARVCASRQCKASLIFVRRRELLLCALSRCRDRRLDAACRLRGDGRGGAARGADIDTDVMRERWRGPSKDGGPPIGRQGIAESAPTFAALRSSHQIEGINAANRRGNPNLSGTVCRTALACLGRRSCPYFRRHGMGGLQSRPAPSPMAGGRSPCRERLPPS